MKKTRAKALSPEAALALMLECCAALRGAEVLPLSSCPARVLARSIEARLSHPSRRVSVMDGYAVVAAEAQRGAELRVCGRAPAGERQGAPLGEGTGVQIFTGGALPEGADAILLTEQSLRLADDRIRVLEEPVKDRYIRLAGSDFRCGETLLEEGRLLTARDVVLAATGNYGWLSVRRKPVVSVVSSGNELALPGMASGEGQVSASNGLSISMLCSALGAEGRIVPFAADEQNSLECACLGAREGADLIVICGGASKSEEDWVSPVSRALGFDEKFSELAMRPGKPTRFALWKGLPILTLPGNPVSVYVGAVVFLVPILRKLSGLPPSQSPLSPEQRPLTTPIERGGTRDHYMRAQRQGKGVFVFPHQDSSHTRTLAQADALVHQPAGAPAKQKGEIVTLLPFPQPIPCL